MTSSITVTVPVWLLWIKGLYGIAVLVLAAGSLWVLCSHQTYKFKTECGSICCDNGHEMDNVSEIEIKNAEMLFHTSSARWLVGLSVTIIVWLFLIVLILLFRNWFSSAEI